VSVRKASNRLKQLRQARGVAAAALARAVGISRQTIYAIEDGSYTPNTVLALQFARELKVRVEDIFSLEEAAHSPRTSGPVTPLSIDGYPAWSNGETCQVGDKLISLPAPPALQFLPSISDRSQTGSVVIAGCDPALPLLGLQDGSLRPVAANSRTALRWLRDGLVHLAGMHLFDNERNTWNLSRLTADLAADDYAVLTFALWELGFASRQPVRSFADLANANLRFMNREQGAGSRELLDLGLKEAGLAPSLVNGYGRVRPTHLAVAYAVATGEADCCLTNSAAAHFYGLRFTPVRQERFDLVVAKAMVSEPTVERLLQQLSERRLRQQLRQLPGYSTNQTGKLQRLRSSYL
jgi:putative molybdopterin biosynthesis protein